MATKPTHSFVGVYDGVVQMLCVDLGDEATGEMVADVIRHGGQVHYVPIDAARGLMHEPWPPVSQQPELPL